MRVELFSDTVDDVNGVARFVRGVASEAKRSGRDLEVVACGQGEGHPNVRTFRPRLRRRYRRYPELEYVVPPVAQMVRHTARRDPSAIHVSTPGPVGLVGLLAAKLHDKPLLGVYHTDVPAHLEAIYGTKVMRLAAEGYMRAFYGLFHAVFARSPAYLGVLKQMGLPDQAIVNLPAGLDTGLFNPTHRRGDFWGAYPSVRPKARKLLYVGRLAKEKNLDFLADIWDHARRQADRDLPLDLVVVGSGPSEQDLSARLGAENVSLLGYRHGPELASLYANSDLFVFPSVRDTLGQVVMESQACGIPAFVSDQGGPKTLVEDGRTGRILPVDDPGRWADELLALARDDTRRVRMGAAAAQHMQARAFKESFERWWAQHEAAAVRTPEQWPYIPAA